MVHSRVPRKPQQVSDVVPLPPGLAPPPGLPAPARSTRKKAARRHSDELAAAGCPPGLTLPPGLETIAEDVVTSDSTTVGDTSPPPSPMFAKSSAGALESNLESVTYTTQVSGEIHQVQLTGLPNEILNDQMLRAVLQQAQLNGCYSSFTTSHGKSCGEALIELVSQPAAEWCVQHFHGRRWAANDTLVSAYLLTPSSTEHQCESPDQQLPEEFWLEAWFHDACELGEEISVNAASFPHIDTQRLSAGLSAGAPAFVPSYVASGGLSAEAPVFVPGQKSTSFDQKSTNTSDASTVDEEESESDDEKVAVEVAA